jgi:hypothetical protein
MQICLITREYPSLGTHGGIGTYTQNLVRGLAARGHKITVIARADEPTAPFFEGGVRIEPVHTAEHWHLPIGNRYVGMASRALPFITAAARRYQALERERPFDVVEVPEYQGWGLGVSLVAKAPVVVRLHSHSLLVRRLNDTPMTLDGRIVAALESAAVRKGVAVISNSRALAEAMACDYHYPLKQIEVLPLGIDAELFAPQSPTWLRTHLGLAPDAPILLYVGRLERRKGVETLMDAFGQIHTRYPNATLVMAGFSTDTGPEQRGLLGVLRERAIAVGCADRVRFLGHVPYDQLPLYYSGCDVFMAPSLYEPFGMVYLEAMACSRPTIGCHSGGVPEIIRDGESGLLVPPGNAEALAESACTLLADPERARALGERAREAVLADFSLPVIAARTEARYQAIAAQHAADHPALEDIRYVQTP